MPLLYVDIWSVSLSYIREIYKQVSVAQTWKQRQAKVDINALFSIALKVIQHTYFPILALVVSSEIYQDKIPL